MQRFEQRALDSIVTPAVKAFVSPGLDSRPMARMWFPDAGAGERDDDCILEQLQTMAAGGMGGVEIALLADGTGLRDGRNYGWGTPNWVKTLKKVMKAARSIEGGFKVDFTITAHWPPIVCSIDPNDPEASSDLLYAWKKVTAADLKKGFADLPMPETKLYDSRRNPFIFANYFAGASLARVSDVPRPKMRGFKAPPEFEADTGPAVVGALPGLWQYHEPPAAVPQAPSGFPGGGEFMPEGVRREDVDPDAPFQVLPWRARAEITLQANSLLDVTARTGEKPGDGWRAGVPDKEALQKWYGGRHTEADIEAIFGPPAGESDLLPDRKRDSLFNKKRMADCQKLYETDLSGLDLTPASEGDALMPGDLVLIGFFYRGSGQAMSGGGASRVMPNQTYVANYLIPEGTRAITDYWDRHILSDPELLDLIKQNGAEVGGAIFEDSIELSTYGAAWGLGFDKLIPEKLGYPIGDLLPIIAGFATDDPERDNRVAEDFGRAVAALYKENHAGLIRRWAEGFNYAYRAQAYSLHGLGVVEASLATGITEGDNSTYDDGLRQLQTVVNVKPGEKVLSMESNTFNKFGFSWSSLVRECNWNASSGVNRVIFHGCAYPVSYIHHVDWWPGWNWGEIARANTFMAWDARNTWWLDAKNLTGYLSRMQSVLQEAKRKVDLAVLPSIELIYDIASGNSHQALLDRGYSYNLLDENVLDLPGAAVSGGALFPDGPAYRALLLDHCDALSEKAARQILAFAKAGLPVIMAGPLPDRVFGTCRPGNDDTVLHSLLTALLALPNTGRAENDEDVLAVLAQMGLKPAASYHCPGLECSHLSDGAGDYYYFYNARREPVETDVALSGSGVPVRLDCWSGEVQPFDGGKLCLAGGDMAIIGLVPGNKPRNGAALAALPELTAESFSLELDSFGPPLPGDPEYSPSNPTRSHRTVIRFDGVAPKTDWAQLSATEEDLERLRVPSMSEVAGVGTYRAVFDLPASVTAADLKFAHHRKDMVCSVTVNGIALGAPNCMTDVMAIDRAIRPGPNEVTVKLAAVLDNRLYYNDGIESAKLPADDGDPIRRFFKPDFTIRRPYGLYALSLVPYTAQ